jgi:hypothetical protein
VTERLKQQLRRTDAVYVDARGAQKELNGLKDMGLIVGNQNPDSILLTGDGPPPVRRFSLRRL